MKSVSGAGPVAVAAAAAEALTVAELRDTHARAVALVVEGRRMLAEAESASAAAKRAKKRAKHAAGTARWKLRRAIQQRQIAVHILKEAQRATPSARAEALRRAIALLPSDWQARAASVHTHRRERAQYNTVKALGIFCKNPLSTWDEYCELVPLKHRNGERDTYLLFLNAYNIWSGNVAHGRPVKLSAVADFLGHRLPIDECDDAESASDSSVSTDASDSDAYFLPYSDIDSDSGGDADADADAKKRPAPQGAQARKERRRAADDD